MTNSNPLILWIVLFYYEGTLWIVTKALSVLIIVVCPRWRYGNRYLRFLAYLLKPASTLKEIKINLYFVAIDSPVYQKLISMWPERCHGFWHLFWFIFVNMYPYRRCCHRIGDGETKISERSTTFPIFNPT